MRFHYVLIILIVVFFSLSLLFLNQETTFVPNGKYNLLENSKVEPIIENTPEDPEEPNSQNDEIIEKEPAQPPPKPPLSLPPHPKYSWKDCLRFAHQKSDCVDDVSKGLCRTDILQEMLWELLDELKAANFTHWISYGTLLGAVRDNQIIPWTLDCDTTVMFDDFEQIKKQIGPRLDQKGFLLFQDYKGLMRVCVSPQNGKYSKWKQGGSGRYYDHYPYLDIYGSYIENERVRVITGPPCKYKVEDIFPLGTWRLYDRNVSAPRNPQPHLTQTYGPTYLTPPPPARRTGHGRSYCPRNLQPDRKSVV